MDIKKLHFETLQLHVGQEQADPTTDAQLQTHEPYLSIRQLRTFFIIQLMQLHASPYKIQETSTEDFPTQHKMSSKNVWLH